MQNEALFAKTPDSEDVYTTVELENMLNKALSQLPENVRTVFEKSRFEGKTYSEIASEQNISVKTVEAHITKALKYLRVALKDYLPLVFLFL
jgi:RNA polymerase sigma-70 factor (ECF subfamily)